MKAILVFTVCILIFSIQCMAQRGHHDFGARSKGMGNSNSTLADEWSIFNNVGGVSGVENGMVFFGYNKFFEISGFNNVAAGAIHPGPSRSALAGCEREIV